MYRGQGEFLRGRGHGRGVAPRSYFRFEEEEEEENGFSSYDISYSNMQVFQHMFGDEDVVESGSDGEDGGVEEQGGAESVGSDQGDGDHDQPGEGGIVGDAEDGWESSADANVSCSEMIPIILKDFQWSQNESWIFISVNVPKVKTGSVDVTTSPKYVKVYSAPGFIFEAFLAHEVDDKSGECIVDEQSEQVSFRLKKLEGGGVQLWEDLEDKSFSKEEKQKIRKEAVEITQQRSQKAQEEKEKRRFERKQATVHDQIRLDSEAKERITSVKNFESSKALLSLQSPPPDPEDEKQIFSAEDDVNASIKAYQEEVQRKKEQAFSEAVEIRPSACISVSFTPRPFPTPSRESTHAEEQEWLKKQTEARKLCGFVDEDLRPEEKNPEWLLDKGLSLMRTGSYLGAISAFSMGVRLAPKMPELLVERAGAHLAAKNYHKTVEDSTEALELLTPKVSQNLMDRLKCHVRRGAAFRALDMWEEALSDYKEAERLAEEKPGNPDELTSLQEQIKMALRAIPNEMGASSEVVKVTGETETGDGDSLK